MGIKGFNNIRSNGIHNFITFGAGGFFGIQAGIKVFHMVLYSGLGEKFYKQLLGFLSLIRFVNFILSLDLLIWLQKLFVGVSASRFLFAMYFLADSCSS